MFKIIFLSMSVGTELTTPLVPFAGLFLYVFGAILMGKGSRRTKSIVFVRVCGSVIVLLLLIANLYLYREGS